MVDYTSRSSRSSGGGVALFVVTAIAVLVVALAIFDSRSAGRVFDAPPAERTAAPSSDG